MPPGWQTTGQWTEIVIKSWFICKTYSFFHKTEEDRKQLRHLLLKEMSIVILFNFYVQQFRLF